MEYTFRGQAVNNDNVPLSYTSSALPSLGDAMLQDSSAWTQSVHNLRYGIFPRKKPEEMMTYQGLAEYKTEPDSEMTKRYERYQQERRRAEYLRQKMEEKQAELEELRQQAERAEIEQQRRQAEHAASLERSRQKAMFAQQQEQQAIPHVQYHQYGTLATIEPRHQTSGPRNPFAGTGQRIPVLHAEPTATYQVILRPSSDSPKDLPGSSSNQQFWRRQGLYDQDVAVTVKDGNIGQIIPAPGMQLLGQSITSSPTYRSSPAYRFASENDPNETVGFTGMQGYKAVGVSRINANGHQEHMHAVGRRVQTDSRKPSQSQQAAQPHPRMTSQRQNQSPRQQPYALPSIAYTPAPSVDETDFNEDTVEATCRTQQQTTTIVNTNESTPPADTNEEMPIDDPMIPSDEALPSTSPTLSDIIGSETSSEDEGEDEDGDWEFDPRSPTPQPPSHRDVKGFGMRTRRASMKGRR